MKLKKNTKNEYISSIEKIYFLELNYKYNCISFLEKQMVLIFNVNNKRLTEEKIKQLTNLKIRRNLF